MTITSSSLMTAAPLVTLAPILAAGPAGSIHDGQHAAISPDARDPPYLFDLALSLVVRLAIVGAPEFVDLSLVAC